MRTRVGTLVLVWSYFSYPKQQRSGHGHDGWQLTVKGVLAHWLRRVRPRDEFLDRVGPTALPCRSSRRRRTSRTSRQRRAQRRAQGRRREGGGYRGASGLDGKEGPGLVPGAKLVEDEHLDAAHAAEEEEEALGGRLESLEELQHRRGVVVASLWGAQVKIKQKRRNDACEEKALNGRARPLGGRKKRQRWDQASQKQGKQERVCVCVWPGFSRAPVPC